MQSFCRGICTPRTRILNLGTSTSTLRRQLKRVRADGIRGLIHRNGDPRYILDLLARIVTVSIETHKVVDALPALRIRDHQA